MKKWKQYLLVTKEPEIIFEVIVIVTNLFLNINGFLKFEIDRF